ncbi:unnamed protein product, partial [Ectocarpus sp. 12 AP-2014]
MDSLMGRAGVGTGVAGRVLQPLRGRLMGSETGVHTPPKYLSIDHLRTLHQELVPLLDSADGVSLTARQELRLIEVLRSISELVAFGEAGEGPEYFEFFCEKSTMALFVKALRLGPAVKTQVVQGVSVLFQNLRSPTSLYMLLSSDHINRLMQPEGGAAELPLDDEEFLTNYIALLKAIAIRLSKETVPFFLNTTKGSFPLYSRSIPLIGHPDPMVRTSALSIALQVFSVKDPGVTAFLTREENHIGFFDQLSRLVQDAYSQVLCRMWQDVEPSSSGESTAIDGATSFFQDMLYYVQDVLSVGDSLLSEKLARHLHRHFFRPVVLGALADSMEAEVETDVPCTVGEDGEEEEAMAEERESELQLALYALCQLFMLATDGPLLVLVAAELFGRQQRGGGGSGDTASPNSNGGSGGGVDNVSPSRIRTSTSNAAAATMVDSRRRSRQHSCATAAQGHVPAGQAGGAANSERESEDQAGVNRYRKSLLACVKRRRHRRDAGERGGEGAQVRLAATAVLWSAARNPSPTVADILLEGAPAQQAEGSRRAVGRTMSWNGGTRGGGGGDSNGTTTSAGGRQRPGCFEQVMACLLEALTEPPAADMVAVRTAVAVMEELSALHVSSSSRRSGSGGGGGTGVSNGGEIVARDYSIADVGGDSAATHPLPPGGFWAPGCTRHTMKYAVMLTDVYARSA